MGLVGRVAHVADRDIVRRSALGMVRLMLNSGNSKLMTLIRESRKADLATVLAIVNAAAQAYRGVIPADQWREPYMPQDGLENEIAEGVIFWVAEVNGRLGAVMGIQDKGEVALVRHAYVSPILQRRGVGTSLLRYVQGLTSKPILIGTWADALWAIEFYRRNGFTLVPNMEKDSLIRKYWSVPARQAEVSVVLANPRWMDANQRMAIAAIERGVSE